MSVPKTMMLEQQTKTEQGRSTGINASGHHQVLSKSMSESHINASHINQKNPRASDFAGNSEIRDQTEQNEHESDAKNGCAIM